ncbi:DUF2993 domain-containing protein [Streptomyces sp. NRRL B-24484]|uniref:LmeA family phospholipid-binding protein n=1 Tax=Streptomyces sp. NRRL B-24484 TaxID=1463833 RepID=UPI000AA427AC|nr:DUF2993 domain-containing protein [Streptomyces sp. NRRL B-24484]
MRGWLKATIGLAALAGLLAGADRVAVGVAEDEAADRLAGSGRMAQRPTVHIDGFPFLTQALAKEFDDVRLSGEGMTVGNGSQQVALRSFSARLSGVSVGDGYRSATVRHGSGTGLISYADAARLAAPQSGVPGADRLELSYGGPGKVKASLMGVSVGQGDVHSSGNTITADGFRLTGMASVLNGALGGKLGARSFTLTELPAGLNLSGAVPEPDGLRLTFQGENVSLIG